jgi:hypothetical protein
MPGFHYGQLASRRPASKSSTDPRAFSLRCRHPLDAARRHIRSAPGRGVPHRIGWTRDAVKDIYRRGRFYLGYAVEKRGRDERPGRHEPIISQAEYDRTMAGVTARRRVGNKPKPYRHYRKRLEQLKKQHEWADLGDAEYLQARDDAKAALARLPDGDRITSFDAYRASVLELPDAIAVASPARRAELCRLVVERVVVRDRQLQSITWTTAARPFFEK